MWDSLVNGNSCIDYACFWGTGRNKKLSRLLGKGVILNAAAA